jgi:hypothetical protein
VSFFHSVARGGAWVSVNVGRAWMSKGMRIVPPSGKPREVRVTTRPKAVVITALSVLWGVLSFGVIFLLSPEVSWWGTVRLIVWALQGVWLVAAVCLWRFERPREITIKHGLPEPPVIHGV